MLKKIFCIICLIVLFTVTLAPIVQCDTNKNNTITSDTVGNKFDYSLIPNKNASNTLKKPFGNLWKTAIFIIQVLAVAAVVIAGVRYMFASSDQKADIKKGLIYIVIGAVIVFGAATLISLITNTFKEIV